MLQNEQDSSLDQNKLGRGQAANRAPFIGGTEHAPADFQELQFQPKRGRAKSRSPMASSTPLATLPNLFTSTFYYSPDTSI